MAEPTPSLASAVSRLTSVSRAVTHAATLDEVLDLTVQSAADLLHAETAALMLTDPDDGLVIRAHRGLPEGAAESFRAPLDERLLERISAALGPDGADRFLGVPLVLDGGVAGLLAVVRPDGAPTGDWEECLMSALADQAAAALASARISEVRTILRDRVRTLERSAENRNDVLRMLDHDLRSPVSALRGYAEMLLDDLYGPLNERQRTALGRIRSISRHLSGLLDNVNAMTQLSSGAFVVEPRPTEPGPLVNEAVDVVRYAARGARVEIRIETIPDVQLRADPDRLRQVLIHLVDNAVKYSPPDTVVRIGGVADGGALAIRVADQGPGIPSEDVDTVFQAYKRLDATEGAVQGAGLGLYLARTLVELMNGTLDLDEEVSEGATFVIRLPLA